MLATFERSVFVTRKTISQMQKQYLNNFFKFLIPRLVLIHTWLFREYVIQVSISTLVKETKQHNCAICVDLQKASGLERNFNLFRHMCEVKDPSDTTLLSAMGKPIKITELEYVTLPSDFNETLSMYVQNRADSAIYKSDIFKLHFIFFFLETVGTSLNFSS